MPLGRGIEASRAGESFHNETRHWPRTTRCAPSMPITGRAARGRVCGLVQPLISRGPCTVAAQLPPRLCVGGHDSHWLPAPKLGRGTLAGQMQMDRQPRDRCPRCFRGRERKVVMGSIVLMRRHRAYEARGGGGRQRNGGLRIMFGIDATFVCEMFVLFVLQVRCPLSKSRHHDPGGGGKCDKPRDAKLSGNVSVQEAPFDMVWQLSANDTAHVS